MLEGQESLVELVNTTSFKNLPRTIMMVGKEGCGKHTLCRYMADKYKLPIEEVTDKFTQEYIEEITLRVSPYIYLINGSQLTPRDQSMLLKLLEEPLANSVFILLVENTEFVLETIVNRCQVWTFKTYSKQYLAQFLPDCADKDIVLTIADTPGKVMQYQNQDIAVMVELSKKVIEKVVKASFVNTLSIDKKMGFQGEKDKLPIFLFRDILMFVLRSEILQQEHGVEIYDVVKTWAYSTHYPKVNQKVLFDSFLIKLWKVTHNG